MDKIYSVGPHELSEYDFKDMNGEVFEWIVYWYENGGYDGNGTGVGFHKEEKQLYVKNLGHCSCYGPMDGGLLSGEKMTIEFFLSSKDDIHTYDPYKELKDKVRELIS